MPACQDKPLAGVWRYQWHPGGPESDIFGAVDHFLRVIDQVQTELRRLKSGAAKQTHPRAQSSDSR